MSWVVKALVEATPISGPACVSSVASLTRVAWLPSTLQMQASSAPRSRAASMAESVSAVSPDCEMPSASTSFETIGSR